MHWVRAFVVRILNLFRRRHLERDVRQLLESHVQMLEDEFTHRGMEPGAARAAARRTVGNQLLIRERTREQHTFAGLDTLTSDVRLAVRRLRRYPSTAIVSILALAVGIGAAATTSSLVSAVLLHPLPVNDPDRLVIVGSRFNQHGYPVYSAVRESGVFEAVSAVGSRDVLIGRERPELGVASFTSHDFFDVLGVAASLGRDFIADDEVPGAPLVAMLSDRYWRRAFGARPDVVGAQVIVSGQPATVVGVLPRQFRGLDLTELPAIYLPLQAVKLSDPAGDARGFLEPNPRAAVSWITVLGRLRPETERTQAASRLKVLFPGQAWSEKPEPLTSLNATALLQMTTDLPLASGSIIAVTAALLLAIGCLAAGVLLLLRTEGRGDEFTTCLALGATRGRLIRGVFVEGGLLALAGLLLALPAFAWLQAGAGAFELPGGMQLDLSSISVDLSALVAAGTAALVATLAVSIAAALFVLSFSAARTRPQANATPPPARARTRRVLAVGQVAISVVLLAGTALFARSISGTLALGPGEEIRRLLTGTINPFAFGYKTDERASEFFDTLQQQLRRRPTIDVLSIAKPYTNSLGGVTIVNGVALKIPSFIYYQGIDEHYFSTLGLPVVAGRGFSGADRAESQTVAIVSESLGRVLAPDGDSIGRRLGPIWWRPTGTGATIVGVVPDVLTSLALRSTYVIYMPVAQMPGPHSRTLFVRTANPAVAIADVVSTIRAIDPAIVPPPMQSIGSRLDEQMRAQRFGMFAMGGVGVTSALLTALGTYVLAASLALRRRRELAIRSALGAPRGHLGLLVLRESGVVAVAGILVGVVVAWAGLESIRAFLFQIEPFDPLSIASAAALLLGLILTVSLKPARAAMRTDVARLLAEQ